jgi:hypothetical protein
MVIEKRLELIDGDGSRTPFTIQVGQPYEADRCWKCPVGLIGLPIGTAADICGEDSVQALYLALGFVKLLLEDEWKRGNRVVEAGADVDWPSGGDHDGLMQKNSVREKREENACAAVRLLLASFDWTVVGCGEWARRWAWKRFAFLARRCRNP